MSYLPLARTDVPSPFLLQEGDVHVWQRSLEVSAASLATGWNLLSGDERARAARFRFDRDRRRFVVARSLLRTLLGCYAARPPASIVLTAGEHGKPMLEPAGNLEFNVSHSHEVAIYAIARRRVGVDIEYVRAMPDALGIARRFFSRRDVETLEQIDPPRISESFFTCWTRTEAYVKGKGEGIGGGPAFETWDDARNAPHGWTLTSIDVPAGYIAALAVEGTVRSLSQRGWTE